MSNIMLIIYLILLGVLLWFPGFTCARNMVKAVAQRKPTVAENILSCIPVLQNAVGRNVLYGSATSVYVTFAASVALTIARLITYQALPAQVTFGTILLILVWVSYAVTWVVNGYVLWDMGTCIQAGFLTKICAFIVPPLAQWSIGRNCIPLMNKIYHDMEVEDANNN